MTETAFQVLVLLFLPPLLLGVTVKTKAWFGGRVGAPVVQLYRDLWKLWRKGMVFSGTTTWVFRAGPVVSLSGVLLAGLFIPVGRFAAPISFAGDLILFAYLFALARFFTAAAALDTGSAFEGMGAARELTWACLCEPTVFFALLVLARTSGSWTLSDLLQGPAAGYSTEAAAPLVLVGLGLFIVMLAENCRIPFDDPATHLELTMIHEVMALDHSGPLLGAILYGAAMKFFVLGALLVHVALPFSVGSPWGDAALFVLAMLVLSVLVGVVESVMARLRLRQTPSLLIGAMLCCGFGYLLLSR